MRWMTWRAISARPYAKARVAAAMADADAKVGRCTLKS